MNTANRIRPLGITIIAVLLGISALAGICGSVFAITASPFEIFRQGFGSAFASGIWGIFGLAIAVAELVLALGLWSLQRWAFWATVVVEVLNMFNSGAGYAAGHGAFQVGCGVHIIPLLILAYLFLDGNVRRAFRT